MVERKRNSLGAYYHNKGTATEVNDGIYQLDKTREFYLFDIIPMGGVRMSQSDKWKTNPNHADPLKRQRKAVTQYFVFKDALVLQANQMGFTLGKTLDAVYFLPMPDSWSNAKKQRMNGMPCEVKPDTDNITKGVKDALRKNDSDIWYEKAEKRWAYKGSILIFK
jgi:Holliday junction resolvase RusA-like endonuclease